jgi:hypothetical protein
VVGRLAANVMQISEGTNSLALCGGIWAFAYLLLCVRLIFLVLIFSKLETILKINQKYFEKSLQLSK